MASASIRASPCRVRPTASAATLTPAIPGNAVNLIQLENANLVTINNLTLAGAGRGVYVQNSTGFSATDETITDMADEGVRIDTNSTVTKLDRPDRQQSGLAGIYINGTTGSIIGADITNSGTSVSAYQAGNEAPSSGLYVDGPVARSAAPSAATRAGASIWPPQERWW